MSTTYTPDLRGVAATAAGLAHTIMADARFDAWFTESRRDDFGGLSGIYSALASAAIAMEEAVHAAGTYEVVDWYLTMDAVADAFFVERVPFRHETEKWKTLIRYQ